MNNTSVESYLREGCGRCERFQTPACNVHRWNAILVELRGVLLDCGLTEAMKWGSPCYSFHEKNVAILGSLNEYCVLSFFRGDELVDSFGVLSRPGPNTRAGRVWRFTSVDEVHTNRDLIAELLSQAMAVSQTKRPERVEVDPNPLPDELEQYLSANPSVFAAFEALTPGRQRSHIIYVSGAKQSEARARRVERCVAKILAGLGYTER